MQLIRQHAQQYGHGNRIVRDQHGHFRNIDNFNNYRGSYYVNGEIHVNIYGQPEGKPLTTGHHDFNDVVVRCIDNRIDAWINGIPFGFTETKQDVAQRLRTGKIGLQLHDGKPQIVSFRNIRVKNLRREQDQN